MKRVIFACIFALLAGFTVSSCTKVGPEGGAAEGFSVKVYSPTKVIAGQEVAISGTGLDAVTSVIFPGGVSVTDMVRTNAGLITVVTPAGISAEGGELSVVAGDRTIVAPVPMTMGAPRVNTLTPNESAMTGDELLVTGVDLEFYKKAVFPGKEGGEVVVNAIDFTRKASSLIRFKVPKGHADGPARIKLLSVDGKETLLPEINLVEEADVPPITADNPLNGVWGWADGKVYGTAGYGNNKEPAWSAFAVGETVNETKVVPSDEEMLFTGTDATSGTYVKRKISDGTILEEGTFAFDMSVRHPDDPQKDADPANPDPAARPWKIGELVLTDATVIVGSLTWDAEPVRTYDILEMGDGKLTLGAAASGTAFGAWAEGTFWRFAYKGSGIDNPLEGTWSWADGKVYGTAGYGNNKEPAWSAFAVGETVSEETNKVVPDDEEMVFTATDPTSGTYVKRKISDGTVLEEGTFAFDMSVRHPDDPQKDADPANPDPAARPWKIGELVLTDATVIVGSLTWASDPLYTYDILELEEGRLTLGAAAPGTAFGAWAEGTFWRFVRR